MATLPKGCDDSLANKGSDPNLISTETDSIIVFLSERRPPELAQDGITITCRKATKVFKEKARYQFCVSNLSKVARPTTALDAVDCGWSHSLFYSLPGSRLSQRLG